MKRRFLLGFIPIIFALLFNQTSSAITLNCFDLKPKVGGWTSNVSITNHCGKAVDLQNAVLEFHSNLPLSGSYWGDFGNMAYPEVTTIISEAQNNNYLIKMPLKFPSGGDGWNPKTTIDNNATITLRFSTTPQVKISNLAFFPMNTPQESKSKITFTLPANPTGDTVSPILTVTNHNNYNQRLTNLPWSNQYVLNDIPYGQYDIIVEPIQTSSQFWQGTATPAQVSLFSEEGQSVSVTYQKAPELGQVTVQFQQSAPENLLEAPVLHIRNETTGAYLQDKVLSWGSSLTIDGLNAQNQYYFSASELQGKEHLYIPVFSPSDQVTVEANQTINVNLTYNTVTVEKETVFINVDGLPANTQAAITATDNHSHTFSTTATNGQQATWRLPVNRQYQIAANSITVNNQRYVPTVTPNQFLLESNTPVTLSVHYEIQTISTKFSPYVDVTLNSITRWDSATSSMQPVGLLDVVQQSGIRSFHLAFVTGQSGCRGTWAGYPVSTAANGFGVPVFQTLHEQGVELIVAFGGLSGQYLAQVCDSKESLAAAYEEVITAYQPEVLDFDVENNMQTNNVQLDRMMQAIKIIKSRYPDIKISFTLPVLPSGLVPGVGENVIVRAAANGLEDYGLNIMAMDYGPFFQEKSMGEYAIDAATNTFNQLKALYPNQSDDVLWNRIEVTPMIGLNDTIPLNFSLQDVETLTTFALEKNLGLLSFWSVTRDHPCDNNNVSIICSSNNPETGQPNQQTDYQFSQTFINRLN